MFLYNALVNAMPLMVAAYDAGAYTPEFRRFMTDTFPSPFRKEK